MCLAVPMKLIKKQGEYGIVEFNGIQYRAGLQLLDNVGTGDYVFVHAGFAIQKLDKKAAMEILDVYRELNEKQ